MSNQPEGLDAHHDALLHSDRELSEGEQLALRRVSERGWASLSALIGNRSKLTYSVATSEQFAICVREHMNTGDWEEMIASGLYECPICHRLLKDRRSPVSSAILLERRRVRELWLGVEQATPEQVTERLSQFRRALGLS